LAQKGDKSIKIKYFTKKIKNGKKAKVVQFT